LEETGVKGVYEYRWDKCMKNNRMDKEKSQRRKAREIKRESLERDNYLDHDLCHLDLQEKKKDYILRLKKI
jgi:hypothetical protein